MVRSAEGAHCLAGNANQEWMDEIMQWDGQGDATTHEENTKRSYPVSPSSTACEDRKSSTTTPHTRGGFQDLLTPTHSSSSPESVHLPDPRLSGEKLREQPSTERPGGLLKRKLLDEIAPLSPIEHVEEASKPASKKRPHNVIEKRYRANLNEKIAELRDSVPSLRRSRKAQAANASDAEEDLDAIGSTNRLKKASILSKAVEHIRHLELMNKKLVDENVALKERLGTLERLLTSTGDISAQRATAFTSETTMERSVPAEPLSEGNTSMENREYKSQHPPQGLIPVPESMRRLRAEQPQEHYGAIYDNREGQTSRNWPARIMLGSLAGLMVMEGFSESNQGSDSKEKGLFGIPLELLDGYWFLRSPRVYIAAFLQYCRAGGILSLIKGFMALSILAFVIFTYLFNSKPSPVAKVVRSSTAQKALSLSSPIEVRRQAWLTSMQILKLPHHSFIPEWLAVNAEWLKYTIRLVLGWSTYSWMTGRTGDDELARIKAWDIAIDAQLAGGDAEISRSRVVLTIFASGLLPKTPSRSMLKALHCRTVLWRVGNEGGLACRFANRIAIFFANNQWTATQQLHGGLPPDHPDALPKHLAYLLSKECDDVLLDAVVQRAYNLMYDRPTNENSEERNGLMDVMVEDRAIRSPLDALAAWWSSHALRNAILLSLADDSNARRGFACKLQSALGAAPYPSAAHARALAVQAAFFEENRAENIQSVLHSLPRPKGDQMAALDTMRVPHFIDSSTPQTACDEILMVAECAMVMAILDGDRNCVTRSETKEQAIRLFSSLLIDPSRMTLLGFAAAYHVLQEIRRRGDSVEDCTIYDQTAASLSLWAHMESPDSACLPPSLLASLEGMCDQQRKVVPERRNSSVSNDTGYGSLDDGEVS